MLQFIKKHWVYWLRIANVALQEAFVSRWSNLLFLLGKAVRLSMSLAFLLIIRQNVTMIAGYTGDQLVAFFLVFQFLDTIVQVMYRGVYVFDSKIRNGEFDFYLAQPISPLFRSLLGKPDINDVIFLLPSTVISFYILSTLSLQASLPTVIWFALLLCNSFLIATALHIVVLAFAVIFVDVQNGIWIYRDITKLGQFPISIYRGAVRFAATFIVPVGVMITVPAEVLLNVPQTIGLAPALTIGPAFFIGSVVLWRWSLKRYSSASS